MLGGLATFSLVILLVLLAESCRIGSDYWLSLWTNDSSVNGKHMYTTEFWISTYAASSAVVFLAALLRSLFFVRTTSSSSKTTHNKMLRCMLNAPLNSYFDIEPTGRIMNRFSKDLDSIDMMLPEPEPTLSNACKFWCPECMRPTTTDPK